MLKLCVVHIFLVPGYKGPNASDYFGPDDYLPKWDELTQAERKFLTAGVPEYESNYCYLYPKVYLLCSNIVMYISDDSDFYAWNAADEKEYPDEGVGMDQPLDDSSTAGPSAKYRNWPTVIYGNSPYLFTIEILCFIF